MSKCERRPTAAMDGTDDVWQTCNRCGACWSGLKGDWVPLYCVDSVSVSMGSVEVGPHAGLRGADLILAAA